MKTILLLSLVWLLLPALSAKTLTGEGYGKTVQQARKRALSELASAVQVEVKSETASRCVKTRGKSAKATTSCSFEEEILIQSDLPLLGVDYRPIAAPVAGEKGQAASLNLTRAMGLYRAQLNTIRRNMLDREQALKQVSNEDARYRLLSEQLADARQYRRYRVVAMVLDDHETLPAPASEADITARLIALEKHADSLPFAARLLARDFTQSNIYLYPPRHRDAVEITPFAAAFRDALAGNVKVVSRRENAEYLMTGSYQILDGGDIHVSYQLVDPRGRILKARSVRLSKGAWKGYRAEPLAPDLDRLIHQGVAVSNAFRATLTTDQGSHDLLFRARCAVRPVVKLSQPGYFYIVGHVVRDEEQYSYLLELADEQGAWHFMRYLPPEQVNRPVALGEFEVSPPFGVEHLQMIAATRSLEEHIPPHQWDDKLGYYVLKGSRGHARAGVAETRGLRPKRDGKTLSAEANLTFTTLPPAVSSEAIPAQCP